MNESLPRTPHTLPGQENSYVRRNVPTEVVFETGYMSGTLHIQGEICK